MLCFLALFASCATNEQLRDTFQNGRVFKVSDVEQNSSLNDGAADSTCRQYLSNHSIERFLIDDANPQSGEFDIGVIELSDDGHVKDEEQRRLVMEAVQKLTDGDQRALLVTFIHGWHHNARTCDSNLACFRRTIQSLAKYEAARTPRRRVMGLYIGWRGDSLKPSTHMTWSTFYGRKRAAHHIGDHGGRDVLLQLHDWYTKENARRTNAVEMVTVGHSFGGALAFSATEALLVRERRGRDVLGGVTSSASTSTTKDVRHGLGDLVILVNPAFEAYRYRVFDADLKDGVHYDDAQLPVLMTIASKADSAVGFWFPVGRSLWLALRPTLWRRARMQIEGLGHYGPFVTHDLSTSVRQQTRKEAAVCLCPYETPDLPEPMPNASIEIDGKRRNLALGRGLFNILDRGALRGAIQFTPRREHWDPKAPYLVVSADRAMIGSHNDIYTTNLVRFLVAYIADFVAEKERVAERNVASPQVTP